MGLAYPIDADREFDTRTTEAPADLMAALDEYLGVMATFMRANRDKSRVGLTAGGQALMRPDEGSGEQTARAEQGRRQASRSG